MRYGGPILRIQGNTIITKLYEVWWWPDTHYTTSKWIRIINLIKMYHLGMKKVILKAEITWSTIRKNRDLMKHRWWRILVLVCSPLICGLLMINTTQGWATTHGKDHIFHVFLWKSLKRLTVYMKDFSGNRNMHSYLTLFLHTEKTLILAKSIY